MRTNILAILAALVLMATPFASSARGGAHFACKTTAECEERQAARVKWEAEWETQKAEQNKKLAEKEKAEQAEVGQAVTSGLEQVKKLIAGEGEINSWIRKNPKIQIVRVVPANSTVIIFYRKK